MYTLTRKLGMLIKNFSGYFIKNLFYNLAFQNIFTSTNTAA